MFASDDFHVRPPSGFISVCTCTVERNYECDVCKKRFAQAQLLANHKNLHLLCNTCGKDILLPQDFLGHFVQDILPKNYVCKKCNDELSSIKKLRPHITRYHGRDGLYLGGLCQECEAIAPTGYVCCVCDEVFDFPKELEEHIITHNEKQTEYV